MGNIQVEMGENMSTARAVSEKSHLIYPVRHEYDFEASDSVIRKEKKFITDTIHKIVYDKKHFGHIFDDARKSTTLYFSELLRRTPEELLSVLAQFRIRDEKSVLDMYGVAPVAYRLGAARGIRGRELDDLSLGVLIHDLGKDGILDFKALHRDGELTEEEWSCIHLHPERGADIIDRINAYSLRKHRKNSVSSGARQTALEHQIYYDSDEGYPDLHGVKPCRKAQIAKIADSLHTLRLRREIPLREGLVDIIHRTQRGEYNPHIVNTLIQLIRKDKSDPRKTGIGDTKTIILQERRSYDS